jgi:hypothetical protein
MDSIFSRLYSYRQTENKNQEENFLIEIFAFCLQTDEIFCEAFFKKLSIWATSDVIVKTQCVYVEGRPDIEIMSDNLKLLIECKVEQQEGIEQLSRYANILEKSDENEKHLLYLTKYYEYKTSPSDNIKFYQLRWADIHDLISIDNQQITIQLQQYLKEQGMSEAKNFNHIDLVTLQNISSTISKMDEVLDGIKPYMEQKIGKLTKKSARSTCLQYDYYCNYYDVFKNSIQQIGIGLGFFWFNDDDVSLCLRIYLPAQEKNANSINLKDFFDKNLTEWTLEEYEKHIDYWYCKYIVSFMSSDEDHVPAMIDFLKVGIDELAALKQANPEIFTTT